MLFAHRFSPLSQVIDWLDEHEDHTACTEEEVREQREQLAADLSGFLKILGVSTDVSKKVVIGPTVVQETGPGATSAGDPGQGGGSGGNATVGGPTKRKKPDTISVAQRDGYLRGPNGCVIADVDDYD